MERDRIAELLDQLGYDIETADGRVIIISDRCPPSLEELEHINVEPSAGKPWLAFQNRWGN